MRRRLASINDGGDSADQCRVLTNDGADVRQTNLASMGGERLDVVQLGRHGLDGDRRRRPATFAEELGHPDDVHRNTIRLHSELAEVVIGV